MAECIKRNARKLTKADIYEAEHKLLQDSLLWEFMGEDRACHAGLAYVCGINDMASELLALARCSDD